MGEGRRPGLSDSIRSRAATRVQPDLLRRSGSFPLPLGRRFARGVVDGYPIDFQAKAEAPEWPREWMLLGGGGGADGSVERVTSVRAERLIHVAHIQWALGCLERYLAGEGEQWLTGALDAGRYLVANQQRGGPHDGGWLHRFAFPHTYPLHKPWLSAMAQGEAASLLVRLHQLTHKPEFADAAQRALRPLRTPVHAGGTHTTLAGQPFLEEYPTDPPSYVLNGAFFALWGLHDVGLALNDTQASTDFHHYTDALAHQLHRWDTGYWSRYDLYPHRVANIANPFYHRLHINLLRAMQVIAPRPQFDTTIHRFETYAHTPTNLSRAYAHKILFRALSPRRPALQRLLPWAS
jgi:heparosan-N-sulfate-glucuronate 5-epimerase